MTWSVEVDTRPVQAMLGELVTKMGDLTPVMREIGEIIVTQSAEAFEQGGLPGHRWKESGRVKAGGGQTLVDTARLRNSLTARASKTKVEVGTNVVYAAAHQFGFQGEVSQRVKAHSRNISQAFGKPIPSRSVSVKAHSRKINQVLPARPFLPDEGSLDWDEIQDTLTRYLV